MRYCNRCVLPDTRPQLVLDGDGVCSACRAHGTRPSVDWGERESAWREVVRRARSLSSGYDCIIPVSGGKDSTWQVVRCLDSGLTPLTVTWRTPGRTAIGQQNLDNLAQLGVDHIDYRINPEIERRFMLETLTRQGDPAIPMHMAIFAIPLALAARFRIPLIVWGENSAFEYGGGDSDDVGFQLTSDWLSKYGVTGGTTVEDWITPELPRQRMSAYLAPSPEELEAAGTMAVFLGYYFPWDPEATYRAAERAGFRADPEGPRTGLYDYADIDCDFISVHHWFKWYKFGFTRLFDNLALEIRNDRCSRQEAIAEIARLGDTTPHEDISKLCAFLRISEEQFHQLAERFRNRSIWREVAGSWQLPGFLIPDWDW